MLSEEDKQEVMKVSTGKYLEVDDSMTFAKAFVERAKLCPDAPAVVDVNSQFTYAEMDRNSNILAHVLIDNGIQPNSFVSVMLDRRKEFPLSVLAIHKIGAGYSPLDFEYPNERLSYMIENSMSKVLITTHDVLAAKMAEGDLVIGDVQIIYMDAESIVSFKSFLEFVENNSDCIAKTAYREENHTRARSNFDNTLHAYNNRPTHKNIQNQRRLCKSV